MLVDNLDYVLVGLINRQYWIVLRVVQKYIRGFVASPDSSNLDPIVLKVGFRVAQVFGRGLGEGHGRVKTFNLSEFDDSRVE